MSTSHIERTYKCYDDCRMEGCPGHTATLDYQSVSNAFHYKDHRNDFASTGSEIGALLSMVVELAEWRVEAGAIVKEAGLKKEKKDIKPKLAEKEDC